MRTSVGIFVVLSLSACTLDLDGLSSGAKGTLSLSPMGGGDSGAADDSRDGPNGSHSTPPSSGETDGATTVEDAGMHSKPSVDPPDGGSGIVPEGGAPCTKTSCERVVFVTSLTYSGALGGVTGANQKCQQLANASTNSRVKGRSFRALLSTTTSAAKTRLVQGTGRYLRPDGTTIAANWVALHSGTLSAAISLDENGTPLMAGKAWTNTLIDGTSSSSDCLIWNNNAPGARGVVGDLMSTTSSWVTAASVSCDGVNHLYCFEE